MIFLFSSDSGKPEISIEKRNENFLYLSKVKRYALGDTILLSNLEDGKFYKYEFIEFSKKNIILQKCLDLVETNCNSSLLNPDKNKKNNSSLHLFWGICDIKTIQKTLPFLNEIGVEKITFVECERTQGNFLPPLKKGIEKGGKLQKILEQSCQQSGRNLRMMLEISSFEKVISGECNISLQNLFICDFPAPKVFPPNIENNASVFIGPEGGFSEKEKKSFQENFSENIYQFSASNVLRSETAVIGICGKILL